MDLNTYLAAASIVLDWPVLAAIVAGAVYGFMVGAIPGLTATMATALLVPVTFFLAPVPAIALIVSTTAMAITAGDIPGTLLRIPGTPASAAYVDESYALTLKGKAEVALNISIMFSALGGMFGAIFLLITGPLLAKVALNFSSFEFFWLAMLGLMTSALVSSSGPVKGYVSLMLGILVSTVGLDITSGQPRFTFGVVELYGGISFIPVMIGMFAFAEILRGFSSTAAYPPAPETSAFRPFHGMGGLLRKYKWGYLRGASLGTTIGALPGVGGDIAAWIAYGMSRRFSKTPEKFGTGHEEGLVEASSSNNAGLSSAWIPAMVFGIPGDAITAIAVGVLYMKGLNPGPRLFTENPAMPTAIIFTFFIANLLLFPIGYLAIKGARHVLSIRRCYIVPVVLIFCILGSFAINNTLFGVGIMFAAGLAGYLLEENGFPIAPIILGIVLGPVLERNFIMSMQIADGKLTGFFDRPIAACIGTVVIILLLVPVVRTLRQPTSSPNPI